MQDWRGIAIWLKSISNQTTKVVCGPYLTITVSSTVDEEKEDERKTVLIDRGTGTPAEEKEEDREREKAA